MTEYYLPTGYGQAEHTEKKSRFIGQIWPVQTEAQAREKIEAVKKQYHDARHNCWCYLLRDGTVRYSDDGEPQGTAGQPMLEVLKKQGVTDAVCVVTRYFGGILLGTGGLARAYTQGARDALDAAGISVQRPWIRLRVQSGYGLFERIRKEVADAGGVIQETDFGAEVTLTALIPEERSQAFQARLTELSAGAVTGEMDGRIFRGVPVRAPRGGKTEVEA